MQTTTYKLNVTPGGVPLTIHISQYDVGLRQYIFQPYTSEGEFTYVTGATVTLEATKPDGYAVIHNCTYNQDGSIAYTVQEQLAAKAGRVWSKVVIRNGNNVLGTGAVLWIVDYAGVKDNAIISDSDISGLEGYVDQMKTLVSTPIAVTTAAGMTDHEKLYLYEGSETGYTAGDWYYWNGSAWTSGGEYGSGAVEIDPTLSIAGEAADAKATGDEITELKSAIDKSILYNVNKTAMWENGSIGSNGANTSNGSTTRIRTIGYIADLHSVINSDYANYNFMVCGYSKTDFSFLGTWRGTAWGNVAWANLGQLLTNFPDDAYYRLCMRKADNSAGIVPASANCLELMKYMTADYVRSTKDVPTIKMRSLYDLYSFVPDSTYPISQGFCLIDDVAIVAKTTGTDTDQTKYVAVRVNPTTLAYEVLQETLLNTKHSNSLAYNPDTGKVVCVTNQTVYIMSVSNTYALSIYSTITTSIHFSAVTYTGGAYYLYGEGYIWKTTDFTNFVRLFIVNFEGYTSQGLATDGTYLYHCTSGQDYNVIWQYTLNGVLVNTRTLSAKDGELEEIDFVGTSMYANIANTSTGGGVYLITADNDVYNSVDIPLPPNTVTSITPIDTANTNRWCAIFEANGSSPNNQGAWLVMGYGTGAGRFSITPIKGAESIALAVDGAFIKVTNNGSTTPRLFIHWLKPTTVTISQAAV